jgi:hypothetical protein
MRCSFGQQSFRHMTIVQKEQLAQSKAKSICVIPGYGIHEDFCIDVFGKSIEIVIRQNDIRHKAIVSLQ